MVILQATEEFLYYFHRNQADDKVAVWHGAPSCWNIQLFFWPKYKSLVDIIAFSKVSLYLGAFKRPSKSAWSPLSLKVMHPHNPIEPPPPCKLGAVNRESYFSCLNLPMIVFELPYIADIEIYDFKLRFVAKNDWIQLLIS